MKRSNSYQRAFGRLYAKTPKSVFAAVAFSYADWACGTAAEDNEQRIERFIEEWRALYDNQIVSQKPPRKAVFPEKKEA